MARAVRSGGPRFTAADLWKTGFVVPDAALATIMDTLDEDGLSLSVSALDEDGFDTLTWQVQIVHEGRPHAKTWPKRVRDVCAAAGCEAEAFAVEPVPDENWLLATATRFPPTEAGRFVVHGAHAAHEIQAGRIGVQVEAGLAFGSGEHATTRGCLILLDAFARRRRLRRVLDMGTGSAVLAIAAAKVWPARVLAVDNDPVAVRVAAENVRINGVAERVATAVSDGYASPLVRAGAPYDLVLANILADPLCDMAHDLVRHLVPGGRAILSGLIDRQADRVVAMHRLAGLRLERRLDIGGWSSLLMRQTSTADLRQRCCVSRTRRV